MSARTRAPFRPVAEISREGALAGHVVSAVLALTGAAFVVAAWNELWQRCDRADGSCTTSAAAAAIVMLFALGAIVAGVALERWVRRRPVDAEGSSRFVVALGAIFAVGCLLIAWRMPVATCARGRYDAVLNLCMHPPSTSEPTSWALLRAGVAALGVAGGVLISVRPRWVRLWAPLAVLAWAVGVGWFILDTLV